MKNSQQDQPVPQQDNVVHNHTLKEALEAKRQAAVQQEAAKKEEPREKAPKANQKSRIVILACIAVAVVLLVALAGLRLFAPNAFYKLFRIDPLKSSGVVMTIDAYEISADEYISYIVPAKKMLEATYGAEALAQQDGLLTILKQAAEESLFGRYTLLKWAEEYGLTTESISQQEFLDRKEKLIQEYGGEEAYKAALKEYCTTDAVQDLQIYQDLVIEKLTDSLASGEQSLFTVTDAEALAYYQENELYTVKHILFVAQDYSVAAKKLESAEKVLALAKQGEDFDQLVKLYSEDTEKESYLSGYICQPGKQEPAFEQAALSVEPGELYGDIAVTSYGYHIIQRIQPSAEVLHQQLDELIVDGRIAEKREQIQSQMIVYYAPGYDNISFAGIDKAIAD